MLLQVVAGHDLEETKRMFLGQLHQSVERQWIALLPRHRVFHLRVAVRVRDDIECPRFPFQPNLQPLGQGQRVRQWVAALNRAELCLRREITHVCRSFIEDGLIRLSPDGLHLERRHPGHAELQKITTRHLEVLSM